MTATAATAPRRHILPPNATALEKAVDQAIPAWDGLADAFAPPSQGDAPAFLPWLAAEWGIAQFDRYFDDVPQLVEQGLPWLRERGTAAALLRALHWLGYDQARLDEDGAWLHLDLGRVVGDADLLPVAHVVRASLPAHVRFYRVFHGHDLRPLRLDHGPGLDAGMLDNDSGTWVDVSPHGGPVKLSQALPWRSATCAPGLAGVLTAQLLRVTTIATYADRMLLDAWMLDSEILIDASLGVTEVNATTTGEPAYYAPLRPVPAQAVATLCAWTAATPQAVATLQARAITERPHDNTRTWTGRWDSTPWRRSFETRTTTTEEPEEP
jgi:hypothetical protein